MAFVSLHLENEAEKKILAYILNEECDFSIVSKKFERVPDKHKAWLWGKIETKIEQQEDITEDQKKRFEEVKKAVGM